MKNKLIFIFFMFFNLNQHVQAQITLNNNAPILQKNENESTETQKNTETTPDDVDDLKNNPEVMNQISSSLDTVKKLAIIAGIMKECKPEYYKNIEACALNELDIGMTKITNIKIKQNIANKFHEIWTKLSNESFNKQAGLMPPLSCPDAIKTFPDLPVIQHCVIKDEYLDIINQGNDSDNGNGEIVFH
jgi:hypothetical protein